MYDFQLLKNHWSFISPSEQFRLGLGWRGNCCMGNSSFFTFFAYRLL